MSESSGSSEAPSLLVFVEDPGAANYIAALPELAAREGWQLRLFAAGAALEYLRDGGFQPEAFPDEDPAGTLRREAPSVVIVGTSENTRTRGHDLVHAARAAGVPSVGVVDAFANAAHRFRGVTDRPLAHAPDFIVVPDEWTRRAYVDLGALRSNVIVCGHPQYDRVREEAVRLRAVDREQMRRELFSGAAPGQRVVVFAAEISTGLDADQFRQTPEYTLRGRGAALGRTEIVLEELLDGLSGLEERPFLVLRQHPKNQLSDFDPYLPEIDRISSGGSPLELVFAADLVVGMTTMLLMEAAILGTRTLAIVPRAVEKEWLPSLRTGVTPCATTRDEVRRELARLLGSAAGEGPAAGEESVLFGAPDRLRRVIGERLGEGRQTR